jgi:hypothetical protein
LGGGVSTLIQLGEHSDHSFLAYIALEPSRIGSVGKFSGAEG